MSHEHVAVIGNSALSIVNFRGSLISRLVAGGHRVSAFAPDYDDVSRARVAALGADPVDFSLDRTGIRIFRDAIDIIGLWRVLRRIQPDCMLTYFVKPNIYGTMAGWLAGVPRRYAMIEGLGYVFTSGEKMGLARRTLQRLTKLMYRTALARTNRTVFLNDDDIRFCVDNHLIDAGKVVYLGGIGVDLDRFRAEPPSAGAPPVFLLIARLLREKGIGEFIAAAAQVRARHPAARFLVVGGLDPNPGGVPEAEMRQAVADGIITWPGAVDDVRPWIAQSTVFALPSYYREGLPRSTQEAMAMARPIITTDAPGCRDTVEEGVNGRLVPMRSVPALVDAMLWFVDHPEAIPAMGAASRAMAERDFDARKKDRLLIDMLLARGAYSRAGATTVE